MPKLLAMGRLVADPAAYGLEFSHDREPALLRAVDTGGQIDLKVAAEIAGITPEELYELNPAFHRWATDPAGPYYLLLPVDAAEVFTQNIAQLTADQRCASRRYAVQHGDTVASVAAQFHTTHERDPRAERPARGASHGRRSSCGCRRADMELPAKVLRAAARVDGRVRGRRRARRTWCVAAIRSGRSHGATAWT